jgi:hypothetical protein
MRSLARPGMGQAVIPVHAGACAGGRWGGGRALERGNWGPIDKSAERQLSLGEAAKKKGTQQGATGGPRATPRVH